MLEEVAIVVVRKVQLLEVPCRRLAVVAELERSIAAAAAAAAAAELERSIAAAAAAAATEVLLLLLLLRKIDFDALLPGISLLFELI